MKINRFHRGSATFPCNVCARLTRDTGVQSAGNRLCPQCYELAGIENEISDGYRTFADCATEIAALMADIAAKGGNVAEWNHLTERENS